MTGELASLQIGRMKLIQFENQNMATIFRIMCTLPLKSFAFLQRPSPAEQGKSR